MLKRKHFFTFVLLLSILFLVSGGMVTAETMTGPSWAFFSSINPEEVEEGGGIGFRVENSNTWIERMVGNAMSYFFLAGMILAPLVILIGAFMFFISGGEPSKVARGKALIIWASVGLAILLSGRIIMGILRFILDF